MLQDLASRERGLVRAIGVRGLAASIVNTTVGAGIFVLPAMVARDLGAGAPLAYVACALAMTLVVASFAMAGSRVSLTGGIYAYVEIAFGPLVGFVTGFLVWLSCLFASASVASALASTIALAVPAAGNPILRAGLLATVYGAFAAANVRGVSVGTRLVETATVLKLLPLTLLVVVGVTWITAPDLRIEWVAAERVGATSISLIFAFVGIEVALQPSGEVREPSRTIPRAIFLALGVTTVLYLVIQLVAQAVLGPALATAGEAPLAEAAARVLGPWGRSLMLVGGAVSMLGFLTGDVLGTSRMLFAFARDGFLPARLAQIHPRFATPAAAIVTHALLASAMATMGTFALLTLLSNVALLTSYFVCCLAAIELRRRDIRTSGEPFEIPGGPLVPLAACAVLAWLLASASAQEYTVTGGAAVVAVLLFAVRWVRRRGLAVAAPETEA